MKNEKELRQKGKDKHSKNSGQLTQRHRELYCSVGLESREEASGEIDPKLRKEAEARPPRAHIPWGMDSRA